MPVWFADPQLRDTLLVLLTLYPIARVLRRLGLAPWLSLLTLASLVLPLLGHLLVVVYALSRPWPALPPLPPAAARRTR
jgi:antibiotic biosynthesis monooxygenase (ABM) superfamily enzyme